MRSRVAQLVAVALLVGLWIGCGPDNPLGRQSISGTVTLNGQPVAKGTIRFVPVSQDSPTIAGGQIENGSYSVGSQKGAAPGEYVVNINIPDPNWDPKKDLHPKDLAPPDYAQGNAHKVTVSSDKSNEFNFELQSQ